MSFGFIFTNLILKNVIARPRPFFDQNSIYYDYWVQAGSLSEKGYSLFSASRKYHHENGRKAHSPPQAKVPFYVPENDG